MRKNPTKPSAQANQSPVAKVSSLINSVYQRTPVLPFFDKPSSALLIICIVAFLAFTIFVFATTKVPEPQQQTLEAPLIKNSALLLAPGEQYSYLLAMGNQSSTVDYSTSKSASCPGLLLTEREIDGTRNLCLASDGSIIGNDTENTNLMLGNSSTVLFNPWMLAVSDNFTWKVEQVFTAGASEISIPTYFTSQGRKQVAGREAFQIGIENGVSTGTGSTMYIDSQKRVLLYADISNITIRLVSAPFALDWNQTNSSNGTN